MEKDLDFRNRTWRTADGRAVLVKDMKLGHLVNVINWIQDNAKSYPKGLADRVFIREAKYRQLVLFAKGEAYPGLVDGRWRIIDPQTGATSIEKPPEEYIEAVKDNTVYQSMYKRTQKKRQQKG